MVGNRKWTLTVLTLIAGTVLAWRGSLTSAFLDLAMILNGLHHGTNVLEHVTKEGGLANIVSRFKKPQKEAPVEAETL